MTFLAAVPSLEQLFRYGDYASIIRDKVKAFKLSKNLASKSLGT